MAGIDKWKKVITEFGAKAICVGNYEYFKADNDYGALDVAYYPAKIFNAVLSKDGKGPGYCPFPRTKAFNDYAQCLDYLFSKSIVRKKQMEEWEADKGKSLRLLCREIRGYKWNLPRNTFMVFDEGHKCKSPDSQNMRLLAAAKGYVTEVLTATPGVSPRDFKATGYVLGLHRFYDFDLWTEGHGCRRVFTRGAKKKFIGWDYAKSSGGLELLNKELFPVRAARMRVSEIPGFPETMITAECFSAKEAPEIEKAYLTTVAYCKNAVKENQILQVTAILKYRMHAELLKVPLYAQLIEESIEGGFSVAMFVNFKDTLAALHKKFPEFPLIFGSQKQSEREAGRLRFEKNEVKGILLNSQAGGVSLDLHDVYQTNPRMALISPTYDPYVLKQVFGRVARDGGTKSFQRLIYVAGTQEEKVCESVRKKIKAFQVVNGDDITKEDLIEDVFSGIMKDEILEEVENE
jgi:hypothetical protein